jgi:transglutaminase-like putative cysteine protease
MEIYLRPTYNINSDSPEIIKKAEEITGSAESDKAAAILLYYFVRDRIKYNPYLFSMDKASFVAGGILERGQGYCIQKAILLAALSRAAGIPCRLGFANVRNHLTTKKLHDLLQSDLFVFHGYNEIFINGTWVKATPTFDISLCERFGVMPLDFDGENNAVFHQFDKSNRKHMEYVHDYGHFDDLPFDFMVSELKLHYPHLSDMLKSGDGVSGCNFEAEASGEN